MQPSVCLAIHILTSEVPLNPCDFMKENRCYLDAFFHFNNKSLVLLILNGLEEKGI